MSAFYIILWSGKRAFFGERDAALAAAFAEGMRVLRDDPTPLSNVTIVVFDEKNDMAGQVQIANERWNGIRSWSPASYGRGGDTIELTPEEGAMIQAHRLGPVRNM